VDTAEVAAIAAGGSAVLLLAADIAVGVARRRSVRQRLVAVAARLGEDPGNVETSRTEETLGRLERAADQAAATVSEASSDAIRLRRALDAIPQGVVICNDSGELVFRNSRAASLVEGRHADALAAQLVEELLSATWAGGAPTERTLELYGPPRRTLTVGTHTIDDGQRPLGVIAVIEDVSERRRLEAVRRDFVANVSHELKTPAGALGLLAETLLTDTDPALTRQLAGRIQKEAFRVSRIIDDLLDLSRIEAEEAPPREPVPVNLVLAEAVESVRSAAETQKVELELIEPVPQATVMGDRRQLVSAVHNLLDNAVKYSEPGSSVRVTGSCHDANVDMVVEDRGIGIPARDLERIFERFYRVDHGRSRETGGTGLGLSIVRHVAGNHGGTVLVESREGEGSTFTLRIPVHTEEGR
jgi:two-component system sensor histidine kinase SenX3